MRSLVLASLRAYFADLPAGKVILWCYLIWYLSTVAHHFDPAPAIWLNALGISGVIGLALLLSVGGPGGAPRGWPRFRLFLMPFCVSSFSSLIKGMGFVLIFPPQLGELLRSAGACALFVVVVLWLRARRAR